MTGARPESMKQWLVAISPSRITPPFCSLEKRLLLRYFFYELMFPHDLDGKLSYATFVSGGHLEFFRHFQLLFLKFHIISFLWSRLQSAGFQLFYRSHQIFL
jgi:hypothetical protein